MNIPLFDTIEQMKYILITRRCKCPCQREFKILESSKCEYYSSACSGIPPKPVDQAVLAKVRRDAKKYYGDTFGGSELIEENLTLTDETEKDPQLE